MRDSNGNLSYRAVQKNELEACEAVFFCGRELFLTIVTGKRD